MSSILKVKDGVGTTIFKQSWEQFKDLKKSDPTYIARSGETYFVDSIDRGSSDTNSSNYYGGDHWKVTFTKSLEPEEGGNTLQTWLVFHGDVEEYRLVP